MKIIGLTGGIASGKSTVAKFFVESGIPLVYADIVAHEVMEVGTPAYQDIVRVFGTSVLADDGSLHRRKLGEIVFHDRSLLDTLNHITHPRVAERASLLFEEFRRQKYPLVIYEVPLLFEIEIQDQFDAIVLVALPSALQLERLQVREGLSKEDAMARINSQMSLDEKRIRSHYVIENTGNLDDLRKSTENILKKLLHITGKK